MSDLRENNDKDEKLKYKITNIRKRSENLFRGVQTFILYYLSEA